MTLLSQTYKQYRICYFPLLVGSHITYFLLTWEYSLQSNCTFYLKDIKNRHIKRNFDIHLLNLLENCEVGEGSLASVSVHILNQDTWPPQPRSSALGQLYIFFLGNLRRKFVRRRQRCFMKCEGRKDSMVHS